VLISYDLCCTLTDDHTGSHSIAGCYAWHDRSVRNAKVVDAVNVEIAVGPELPLIRMNAFREMITRLRFTLEIHFNAPLTTQPVNQVMESDLCLHLGSCAQSSGIVDEGSSSRRSYMHDGRGFHSEIIAVSLTIIVLHAGSGWSFAKQQFRRIRYTHFVLSTTSRRENDFLR
jgi:hypothetical protein